MFKLFKPLLLTALVFLSFPLYALEPEEALALVEEIDARQSASADFKAHAFLQRKEPGKEDILYESLFYRRGKDQKFMFLVLAPKTEAGQGYLRIDQNLWLYSPQTGKWERMTERDRILGSDGRRQDFDESRLSKEYDVSYIGEGKLGKHATYRLKLEAKAGQDVAWPLMELDVDQKSHHLLKQLEFAGEGKLMRRTLYPRWLKVKGEDGQEVYYPEQVYFFDEVQKGFQSIMKIEAVDLSPLPPNMFTKAWLESKSR